MDRAVLDYLVDRIDGRRGRRDRTDRRDMVDQRDYENEDFADYADGEDYEDSRRGVRGSGRRGDRRDSRDSRDSRRGDMRDYHRSQLRLTKTDLRDWKRMLENADGTQGAHYDMQQIMSAAEKHDIKFDGFNEGEFCMVVNMMYSDYCKTLKKYCSQEKLLECCVCLALDFLNDPDGPEPSEKVMLYYHCIANA